MHIRLRIVGFLLLTLSALWTVPAAADDYPNKPVRLVVPFPPGGGVDLYARSIQPELSKVLGQPVIIDNRAGASGMIGAEAVAKAAPDGYTLLVGNIAVYAMNPATYSKMSYDPLKDFTPVVQTVMVPYVLIVNPDLPVQTIPELLAYAKANPGKLTYGSSGSGSAQHLAAELFKSRTGADLVHVPYKGVGALVTDLIAGHIKVAFADQASMMPHVKAGKLRLIATAGLQRVPELPDVPTVVEAAKLPGFEISGWQGISGPAGMSPAIVKKLNEAINRVQSMPSIKSGFSAAGLTTVGGTPEEFTRYVQSEIVQWKKVAKDVNVVVD
ncbi:Bug family tripartite tricarboxylate transporter substrate binding protein [Hydrogenophaga palleronii]|uniref:Bug family tripartite tricarboxylate transporter substrate binding protein n=1 Tax=Hydrogenophaga palleronii TaxID=65655 RepID=UPI0008262755|nr:tripartite tricarboxylate transporter substrate binding protein [Hydrogenophaga palleronii]